MFSTLGCLLLRNVLMRKVPELIITEIDFNYAVLSREHVLFLMANPRLQKEILQICHSIFASILTVTKLSTEISQNCH